ncbi:MAG: SpaA isopeptide-forming pilin-related protein, partial [Eubacteriales bacterium]|nr:SpaA isopeptide-forming pilin-related protein [Eubacteriales bacterium]
PTEAQTQAPTEAPTEAQTQAPTEKETKAEKESETEKNTGVYELKDKTYAVEVALPKGLELPKGTEFKLEKLTGDTQNALAQAEEANGEGTIGSYVVYELHFEKDGSETQIKRENRDIEVKLTFTEPLFADEHPAADKVKVFHMKKRTPEEIAQAQAEQETEQPEDAEASEEKRVSEYRAEDLDAKVKLTEDGKAVAEITFKTDGFSEYLIGVTKDPEEKEAETESEKSSEIESEESSAPQENASAETNSEEESEITTELVGVDPAQDPADKIETHTLTIDLANVGEAGAGKGFALDITGISPEDWTITDPEQLPIDVKYDDGSVKADAAKVVFTADPTTGAGLLTLQAPAGTATVTLTGLRAEKTDGTKISYTIDAKGNVVKVGEAFAGTSEYSTIYEKKDAGDVEDGTTSDSPISMELGADRKVSVTNIYTKLAWSVKTKDNKDVDGARIEIKDQAANSIWTTTAGSGLLKGLPTGSYTVTLADVPLTCVKEVQSPSFTAELKTDQTESAADFKVTPISVTFRAVNAKQESLDNATFNVKEAKTGTVVAAKVKSGEALVGKLERGKTYTLEQPRVKNYLQTKNKVENITDNLSYTVGNTSTQTKEVLNIPTKLTVMVVDPYDKAVVGATLKIQTKDGTQVHTFTSTEEPAVLEAVVDIGEDYIVVQTGAPAGYFVGKQVNFKLTNSGKGTVKIKNDTVKVTISRKGYDSRNENMKGKDGYDKNGYLNMKLLAGAELEVQDMNGNVIDSWTSEATAGHTIEGKLAAGTKYRLVEKKTPRGYEAGKAATFETPTTSTDRAIALATRRASGTIQVTKRAAYKGDAIKLTQTYYCALFTDASHTKRYTEGGVRALQMNSGTVYATATFTNVPAGTYYVAETDRNGNVVNGSEGSIKYSISISNEQLNLESTPLISEIVNNYQSAPTSGYTYVDPEELKKSYEQEYSGFGGSAAAAAELASGTPVETGDTTNLAIYIVLLGFAVVLLGVAIRIRKRLRQDS